ncbi:MAG: response regulator, partial [Gammaproteobacteria bacterium]|nr:response regulator [Gammaproteobacteria bacterium]
QLLYDAAERKSPYTIALIDMQMPGMDGATLGKRIKDASELAETHLVLITSQGQRGDAKKMQQIGFSGYFTKPIGQSEFYNALLICASSKETNKPPLITRHTAKIENLEQFQARVLVVEDNPVNQMVAKGIMQKFGLRIDIAGDGREALRMLEQLPFDLIFMDCQMPVMDGYEATRQIRNPESMVRDHDIPVVALTANAMRGDQEKCIAAGMNDYITKPIDPKKVNQALMQWLPEDCRVLIDDQRKENTATDSSGTVAIISEPVFDYDALHQRLMGDEDLIRTITTAFLNDMERLLGEIKRAATEDDVQQIATEAHKIKGAATSVGGMALGEQAMLMEMAGKEGDLETIHKGVSELEQRYLQLKRAIEERCF